MMDERSLRALLDSLPEEKEERGSKVWRKAAYNAQHRVEVLEFKLKKANDKIALLVKQVKGEL